MAQGRRLAWRADHTASGARALSCRPAWGRRGCGHTLPAGPCAQPGPVNQASCMVMGRVTLQQHRPSSPRSAAGQSWRTMPGDSPSLRPLSASAWQPPSRGLCPRLVEIWLPEPTSSACALPLPQAGHCVNKECACQVNRAGAAVTWRVGGAPHLARAGSRLHCVTQAQLSRWSRVGWGSPSRAPHPVPLLMVGSGPRSARGKWRLKDAAWARGSQPSALRWRGPEAHPFKAAFLPRTFIFTDEEDRLASARVSPGRGKRECLEKLSWGGILPTRTWENWLLNGFCSAPYPSPTPNSHANEALSAPGPFELMWRQQVAGAGESA